MMEVYRTPSKETQEILLASAIYAEVIEGLNGYFASEPRNDYITIHRHIDSRTFYLYDPEKWADILISWLRTKHGIFYYPGMEAQYAKMERIPPFTERMMDEGALNSLKALYKRVIGQAVGINSHTLIADSIKCAVNAKEREIKKLKDRIKEIENLTETNSKDIMNYIRHESSRNGFELPEEIDGEPLTIKRVFHDLLELLRQYGSKIKEVNDQRWKDLRDIYKALGRDGTYDTIDGFAKAVEARAEYIESLSRNAERETRKSDTNKLIREYCTEHGIIAPSRYLSDEACIEYLFSVSVAILQDLYRDIFKKQPDRLSAKDIANKILDRVLETEDLLHKSVDSVNKECKATGKMMVTAYKLDLKDYILKKIKELGYQYDGLETKSVEEIVDWIIEMATCPRDAWAEDEIENLRSQIDRLKGLINAMNEEVKDM